MAMEGAITACGEFLQSTAAAGVSGDDFTTLVHQQKQHLLLLIAKAPADKTDATRTLRLMPSQMHFSEEQRMELVKAITMRTTAEEPDASLSTGGPGKNQTLMHPWNYMSERIWIAVMKKDAPEDARLEVFIKFAHTVLGLRFPCQTTKKYVIATLLAARGEEFTHVGAFQMLKRYTFLNNRMRVAYKPSPVTMWKFPRDVAEFQVLFPGRYPESDPPVPSRVAEQSIMDTLQHVSGRSSNSLLGGRANCNPSMSSTNTPAPQSQVMACMQHMLQPLLLRPMMQMMGAQAGDSSALPGFKLLGHARNAAPDGSGGMPSIQDGTRPVAGAPGGNGGMHGAQDATRLVAAAGDQRHDAPAPAHVRDNPMDAEVPDHEEQPDRSPEDVIDEMLDQAVGTSKTGSKIGGKGTDKNNIKNGGKKGVKKDSTTEKVSRPVYKLTNPPKFGCKPMPCEFNGSIIYHHAIKYIVIPRGWNNGKVKAFCFNTTNQKSIWAKVLEFCRNPPKP